MDEQRNDSTADAGYSRRQVLKRGAVVGGTLAWAVPAMQLISMTSASAESPSAPPASPPATPPANQHGGTPTSGSNPVAPQAASDGSSLAYTGFPVAPVVVGGAGLVAAGLAAGAVARKRTDATEQDGAAPA